MHPIMASYKHDTHRTPPFADIDIILILYYYVTLSECYFVQSHLPWLQPPSAHPPQQELSPFRMRLIVRRIMKMVTPTMAPPKIQLII
jgi:hypothetical protein